jgi:hypothetical protein
MDWHEWYGWSGGVGLWGFIIAVVLIGSFFGYMKQKSRNDLIREALRNGQSIDPDMLKDIKEDDEKGGMILGGAICVAVAIGLVFMGYQIDKVEPGENVFEIMKGVAAIPGLVGVVLMIFGTLAKLGGKK